LKKEFGGQGMVENLLEDVRKLQIVLHMTQNSSVSLTIYI
jgi:hypothetical protein